MEQRIKFWYMSSGVSVGNNAVQVNVGGGESSSKTRSTTYNNSQVLAGNIVIKTSNDTTISGANITANNNLTADIGNNLTIESLQDTYYSKSSGFDVNGSIGNSSIGGGYSNNKEFTNSAWVNNQTSLTAGNEVNIQVGTREESRDKEGNILQTAGEGKTTLTGAAISSTTDNLSITTNTLAYNDINDFYISESKGFGLQTSLGSSVEQNKVNLAPSGSTTLTLKSTGEEQEQITRATIGSGTIIIGSKNTNEIDENGNLINGELIAGLNRDTTNTQEITKDQITGALDGSMSMDNRVLLGVSLQPKEFPIKTQKEKFNMNLITMEK